jgi:hypothetical protein
MIEESENTEENTNSRWVRGAFILLFLLAMRIVSLLVAVVAVFQFLHTLFAASANLKAQRFGETLGFYLNEITQFVSYNVDTKPRPFGEWPSAKVSSESDK